VISGNKILKAYRIRVNSNLHQINAKSFSEDFFDGLVNY